LLETITSTFEESAQLLQRVSKEYARQIEAIAHAVIDVYQRGKKVLLFGNGGSAADAQHLAGEFVNRFLFDRPALSAISLSTDTSVLTCISNDASFETVFSRQIEALGREGDLVWGISTSGNSPNVLKAVKAAKERKMITVGFTGGDGGKLAELVDFAFVVPTRFTPRIQEVHIIAGHIVCQLVESHFFSELTNQ
jgi:D-sedoheptulose 7-phosphate isomerase